MYAPPLTLKGGAQTCQRTARLRHPTTKSAYIKSNACVTREDKRGLPGRTYPAGVRSPALPHETTLAYAVPFVKRKTHREKKVHSRNRTGIRCPAARVAHASRGQWQGRRQTLKVAECFEAGGQVSGAQRVRKPATYTVARAGSRRASPAPGQQAQLKCRIRRQPPSLNCLELNSVLL